MMLDRHTTLYDLITGQSTDGTYLRTMFYYGIANSPTLSQSQDANQGNSAPVHYPRTETNLRSSQQDVRFNFLMIAVQRLTYVVFRCAYSVFVMHRRTDLWGPDGVFLYFPFVSNRLIPAFQRITLIQTDSSTRDCENT